MVNIPGYSPTAVPGADVGAQGASASRSSRRRLGEKGAEGAASSLRRVVVAATAGTFLEYYDFAIYGALAPVLAKVFFPNTDGVTSLLSTFAVFAIAFVARPLGSLIWGPVGDRIGRRRTLSMIIVLISVATVLIGLTPGYAAIGVAAPVILVALRLLQGISAGGEIAGASVFIAEHAPARRRGYLVSWLQVAAIAALLAGIFIAALVTALLDDQSMQSWGWRVPFLVAGPAGVIGLYIRMRVDETPSFEEDAKTPNRPRGNPFKVLADRSNLREILWAAVYFMPVLVPFYLLMTFMPTYLKNQGHFTAATALWIIAIAGVLQLLAVPIFGAISDRIGRRTLLRVTMIWFVLLTLPAFMLLNSESTGLAIVGLVLLAVPTASSQANSLTPALERFRTRVRFTGSAATLGVLSAAFAGTAPYVATWLIQVTGSPVAPGIYLIATLVPSLIASFFISETRGRSLLD